MEKSEIAERVTKVTKGILKVDGDIPENANFLFDLGADSLQSIQLVAGLEEEFGIEMDEDGALKVQTVSDAVEFIAPYVNK